jgi:hypothetical protein
MILSALQSLALSFLVIKKVELKLPFCLYESELSTCPYVSRWWRFLKADLAHAFNICFTFDVADGFGAG